ncbi:MAG: hypothetical protein WBJ33_05465 [Candidatus Nanopelagicales bacterium]|jgi:hypothetical protein
MSNEATDPAEIAQLTVDMTDPSGDSADQADRLTMIMEAEAARNGIRGTTGEYGGEGSLDGFAYPLEDTEETLAMEDAEDSSDDPMHAGGLNPAPYIPAENAAMHIVGSDEYLDDETDEQRADPNFDQFDEPNGSLTDEDKTALGIDPYQD